MTELKADPLGPTTGEKLEKGRRRARRFMAWLSFYYLIIVSTTLLYKLLFGNSPEVASAILTAHPVITTAIAPFILILLGYLGVSVTEKIFARG